MSNMDRQRGYNVNTDGRDITGTLLKVDVIIKIYSIDEYPDHSSYSYLFILVFIPDYGTVVIVIVL